jgi:hypothetical protein
LAEFEVFSRFPCCKYSLSSFVPTPKCKTSILRQLASGVRRGTPRLRATEN